ncbi:TAXI family TRAP transporter solute-binding subunit [Glutamicibacter protophormiae]|uniref:TAXI family TRAP transporter solute-binding subunit n=1 Tax=unclassified Kocuria TaxID=2649579 RepID=UPI000F85DD97|nr:MULTISPECIES: TAXI family TRAP transporter solute-binding subunit [unclassified Kocuria]RUP81154.1 TAXI family TRAP transporter solute-binding subunit [Kocuria sp. HSID17590]RUQ06527.1 TAXI family TRAP transporter solute-binding subunit [Kocuria sp. HSID17582]WNB89005.1 TAXI family TRAP transporter solute-binding subunit [Glutamicibacter protophormiae]
MPRTLNRRALLAAAASLPVLAGVAGCSSARTASGQSKQLVWSTYGVGTGTYNDLAAVANTLTQKTGRQIRLMTSDTGIGRLAPLINGTAQYSRTGDEYYYAFEGNDEYCSEQWGPQALRLVWTPPGNYGVLVRKDSGIETVADLKGKKYPQLIASTSINRKLEAILNYGGLTGKDVQQVAVTYSAQIEALKTGQIDALYQNVVGANVSELASQYPIRWLDLGGNDPSRYKTWEELAPMVKPGEFSKGAGLGKGETAVNMQYTIPVVARADRPKEEVAALVADMDRYYPDYKDTTPDAHRFGTDQIQLTPLVIPFHDAMVEFLTSRGRWSTDLQTRQDALLDRERRMREAWPEFWKDHKDAEDPKATRKEWVAWKKSNLPALPETPGTLPGQSSPTTSPTGGTE